MTIHHRHGLVIDTDCWVKPIPDRNSDWCASEDSYEPGMPLGWGATEEAAIADLLERLDEANDDELRHAVETGEWRAP
jgi:hypothetical protein